MTFTERAFTEPAPAGFIRRDHDLDQFDHQPEKYSESTLARLSSTDDLA